MEITRRRTRPIGILVLVCLLLSRTGHVRANPATSFVVDGGTHVRLSGTTRLTLDCDLRNAGAFTPSPGSAVIITGFGTPVLSGVPAFADLTMQSHGTATLAQTASVGGVLTLSSGKLSLAGHDLVVNAATGGSPASYVVTPDTLGRLVRTVTSGAATAFPVGVSAYDPMSIRTTTGSDAFRVAVIDAVAPGGLVADAALTRGWVVSHANAAGVNGDLTYTLQWNAAEQGAQFDRSFTPFIGAYAWLRLGDAWVVQPGVRQSDNGGDPAVNTLVSPLAGLWTLACAAHLVDVEPPSPPRALPREVELAAPFPNPIRGASTIRYALPRAMRVALELYSIRGERIATLAAGPQEPGEHLVPIAAGRMAPGVYFCRLAAGGVFLSRKVLVVR